MPKISKNPDNTIYKRASQKAQISGSNNSNSYFHIHFCVEIGGMANVPLSTPAPPLRNGPHITVEPPLTVTSPQLDCDQSLYFFRFSEGKTRARVENAFSHTPDHFLVSRVSLDRLRKKERLLVAYSTTTTSLQWPLFLSLRTNNPYNDSCVTSL